MVLRIVKIPEGSLQFQEISPSPDEIDEVPDALEVAFLDFRVFEEAFSHNQFVVAPQLPRVDDSCGFRAFQDLFGDDDVGDAAMEVALLDVRVFDGPSVHN